MRETRKGLEGAGMGELPNHNADLDLCDEQKEGKREGEKEGGRKSRKEGRRRKEERNYFWRLARSHFFSLLLILLRSN